MYFIGDKTMNNRINKILTDREKKLIEFKKKHINSLNKTFISNYQEEYNKFVNQCFDSYEEFVKR